MKRLAVFILLLVVLGVSSAHANFYDGFEGTSSEDFNVNWTQQEPSIARVTISTEEARVGTGSVKFILYAIDPYVAAGHRAELQLSNNNFTTQEFWFGISVLTNDTTYNSSDIMAQIHHNGGGSPPWSLKYRQTSLDIACLRRYENNSGEGNGICVNDETSVATTTLTTPASDTAGKWQDWVFHMRIQDDNGILQGYLNGVEVINATGDFGYVDCPIHYFKIGIYNSDDGPTVVTRWEDEFRLSISGSYASACPTIHPLAPGTTTLYPADLANDIPTGFTLVYDDYQEGYADAARIHITDVKNVFSHYSGEFEISTSNAVDADGGFSTTVWTSTVTTAPRYQASVTGLSNNTLYYVHARYRNVATGNIDRDFDGNVPPGDTGDLYWGPWSTITSFTTVASGPTIALNKSALGPSCNTGSNAASDTYTIDNVGSGTVSYTITDDVTWLICTPDIGSSTGEADTITVDYSTSGLAAGIYNATITVTDAGAINSPQTIAVTLTVQGAALVNVGVGGGTNTVTIGGGSLTLTVP